MPRPSDDTTEKPAKPGGSWLRFVRRLLFRLLVLPLLLVFTVVLLLYVPPVQDLVRGKAVSFLSGKTGTPVHLERIRLVFPLDLKLEGLHVADDRGDTLLYAGTIQASVGWRALLDSRLRLNHVSLSDARSTLRQYPDSSFNFDFIVEAFGGKEPKPAEQALDTTSGFQLDLGILSLQRIRFDLDLQPSGTFLQVALGELDARIDTFSLDPMHFIIDAFDLKHTTVDLRLPPGEREPPAYPDLTNPLADIDVRFNRIALEGIAFHMATTGTPDSLWLTLLRGQLEARSMNTTEQQLALKDVQLNGLRFGMITEGSEALPDTANADPPWLDQHDGFRFWTQDRDLAVDRLTVSNSSIAFHTDSIATPALLLDPDHLIFTDIGLSARALEMNNGRMAIKLDSLTVHGGPKGDRLDLSAKLDATTASLSLTEGRITALGNSFAFRATATPGDLSAVYRTPEAVPLDAELSGELRLADLLPLLQQFGVDLPAEAATEERWTTKLSLIGTARNIERAVIDLDGDQGSSLHAHGRASSPAQWPNSTYALTIEDLTMGTGMRQVLRAFSPPDAPLPKRLALKGHVQGRGYDAGARVDMKSDLGDLAGHVEAYGWKSALPERFDMDLAVEGINAARLTGDTALGPISFTVVGNGNGLHGPSRNGTLTFAPSQLSYHGYDLSSLRLKAVAKGDSMEMDLSSDENGARLDLHAEGPWPEPGDSLALQFELGVVDLHLQELGLTPHMLNTEGRITGRIALMPEQRGRFALQAPGLRVFNNERSFTFERLTLNSLLDKDSTAIDLECDVARVAYHANLSIDSTMALMRERLLSAFQEPYDFRPPPGRRIDLKVDLPGTQRLASLLLPELRAMDVDRIEARYDSDRDSLVLNVDIPLINVSGIEVEGFTIDLHAAGPVLEGELAVLHVMRDSIHLDDMVLSATNVPGALRTTLRLRDGDVDRYRIGVDLRREGGVPVLHLQEDLLLDRMTWEAQAGNALYLDPKGLHAEDLLLRSGEQRVELRTAMDGNHLDITGLELANITGLLRSVDSLAIIRGTLDATVLLPLHDGERLKADIALHDLHFMDVDLGTVEAELEEIRTKYYHGTASLEAGTNEAQVGFEADLSGTHPRIVADGDLDLKDISLFKPFAQDFLFDLGGGLTGDMHYTQDGGKVSVLGKATIEEGRFGLIKTGSVYRIPNESVVFDGQGIALNDFEVRDPRDNRFNLSGRVNTAVDREPELDMRLRTERFLLVNSTAKENPMFYGKLFSGIDLHIAGTPTVPRVKGEVSVLDSTALSVVLPGSKVEMIDHTGIVQFTNDFDAQDTLLVKSDSELLRDSLAAQLPGIDLDLRITLDRNARFVIVIDPTTGDAATFRGEADLHFRYDPLGDIYLQGPFTVVDGGYTLEFYGLVKKRFELVPGGTIVWDGDPLTGRMNVQARHSAKVAPFPLVANARGGLTESERNALQAPLPFDVLINIRESVQAPNISFGLDMDRQVRNSYPQVNSVLDQLAKPGNTEELNRQVFGVLVLSTFIENENGTETGGSSLASTAARNSVNGILTQQLNRLTGQGIKGMDIQLGVNTYDQSQGGESYSRTTVDYKVTQNILNDRVSIEAGGSVGYNERRQDVSAMSNTQAPQYAIAYDITEDGRLRLRVYHENAFDLYDGELVNNGVAIMLTRSFEKHFKELERRRQDILKQRLGTPTEESTP